MRLFRRARDTKTSVVRREAVSTVPQNAPVPLAPPSSPVAPVVDLAPNDLPPSSRIPAAAPSYEALEDSDVFVCKSADPSSDDATRAACEVTLFVHGWHSVEPGLLSWTFPSLRAALDAVQRMKNAIGWCVVSGTGWNDLDEARAGGAVLVEQLS